MKTTIGLGLGFLSAAAVMLGARNAEALATGEMYVATREAVYEISAGGDMAAATPFASGFGGFPECMCLGPGGSLYLSTLDGNVWDITAGGDFTAATAFATGLGDALGLSCSSTQILVASRVLGNGSVLDITAGGDFSAATPFATNLGEIFALFRDHTGKLWASAGLITNGAQAIHDITAGGDFSAATPFATLDPAYMITIAERNGQLLLANFNPGRVIDFTAGGNLAAATDIATGPGPVGLLDVGTLGLFVSDFDTDEVYEISAGGDYTGVQPFAFNFPEELDLGGMVYVPGCGDGIVTSGEVCDGDGNGAPGETATCNADCTAASCGDGTVNATAGEDCDVPSETAICDADCTDVSCGDGTTNATAGEDCDDGNTNDGDGCSSTCADEGTGGNGGSAQGGNGGDASGGNASGGNASGGSASGGDDGGDGADDDLNVDSGCDCRVPSAPRDTESHGLLALIALGAAAVSRRRAKSRRA